MNIITNWQPRALLCLADLTESELKEFDYVDDEFSTRTGVGSISASEEAQMSKPTAWVVSWQALGDIPAGTAEFTERARARGFFMIRRASGFVVTIQAKGF